MEEVTGASVPDQALVNEAPLGLRPSGFDPSRGAIDLNALERCVAAELASYFAVAGLTDLAIPGAARRAIALVIYPPENCFMKGVQRDCADDV